MSKHHKQQSVQSSEISKDLSIQMAQMKEMGYSVLPASIASGSIDQFQSFGNILNFSGYAYNPLLISQPHTPYAKASSQYAQASSPYAQASYAPTNRPDIDPISQAGGFASTAFAIPVPPAADGTEIGTPGKGYIPWGANNNLPNIVALVNSNLVYTALCVKFNIDVLCGLGVEPIYEYHATVGCNENESDLSYKHAGSFIQSRIERLRSKMFNILREHEAVSAQSTVTSSSITDDSSLSSVITVSGSSSADKSPIFRAPIPKQPMDPSTDEDSDPSDEPQDSNDHLISELHASDGNGYKRYADTILDDMIISYRNQIKRMEKEYKVWAKTNDRLVKFDRNVNQPRFAHDLATDLVQYNIGFVEIQLSQDATRQPDPSTWHPTITGIRYRDALTCRLEEKDDAGVSRYVYISNAWLDTANSNAILTPQNIYSSTPSNPSQLSITALPALDPSSPLNDLTSRIRHYRSEAASAIAKLQQYEATVPVGSADYDPDYHAELKRIADCFNNPANRPCRFILPIDYRTSGRFYYPQPAYWSIYKDIYQYASNIIRYRAIRKQNENMFTYVLYVHQGYLERLTNQINAQQTEEQKRAYKQAEINKIKSFLSDKQNNGATLAASTFTGTDGKDHDAFRVERIDYANTKQNAEADKTEITDLSSLICFAFEAHPDLIGATPGVSSNGGTYQREMLLINQVKKANMQQLMLAPYYLHRDFNGLDQHLYFHIRQKTLTTLDASKTGTVEE